MNLPQASTESLPRPPCLPCPRRLQHWKRLRCRKRLGRLHNSWFRMLQCILTMTTVPQQMQLRLISKKHCSRQGREMLGRIAKRRRKELSRKERELLQPIPVTVFKPFDRSLLPPTSERTTKRLLHLTNTEATMRVSFCISTRIDQPCFTQSLRA